MSSVAAQQSWQARLELVFRAGQGRTSMQRRSQLGPLVVQRPFYPESTRICHVYLLHPPGGVVGGDSLELDVQLEPEAWALLTTPAAGKFYRSGGRTAALQQCFRVANGATLEWLPQETIVYEGAEADCLTRVELAQSGRFIGWEMLALGRPASGEGFDRGCMRQRFECWRAGSPVWLDRGRYQGGADLLRQAWGMQGYPLSASMVCVGADASLLNQLRAAVACDGDERFSASCMEQVMVCRYLGHHAQRAREVLSQAWQVLRPAVLGMPACEPRIWRT